MWWGWHRGRRDRGARRLAGVLRVVIHRDRLGRAGYRRVVDVWTANAADVRGHSSLRGGRHLVWLLDLRGKRGLAWGRPHSSLRFDTDVGVDVR